MKEEDLILTDSWGSVQDGTVAQFCLITRACQKHQSMPVLGQYVVTCQSKTDSLSSAFREMQRSAIPLEPSDSLSVREKCVFLYCIYCHCPCFSCQLPCQPV